MGTGAIVISQSMLFTSLFSDFNAMGDWCHGRGQIRLSSVFFSFLLQGSNKERGLTETHRVAEEIKKKQNRNIFLKYYCTNNQ